MATYIHICVRNNVLQTEQCPSVFRNGHVYTHMCTEQQGKRGHKFEREQERYMGRFGRKKRERDNCNWCVEMNPEGMQSTD